MLSLFFVMLHAWSWAKEPISIATFLKPAVYQKVLNDREVMTHAVIEGETYSYYASVLIRSSLKHTRGILTDYQVYKKLIPYIDQVEYYPEKKILKLEGGIWKFRLKSVVQFVERSETWIQYKIIDGHLLGLAGDIYFESQGEQGTMVYFAGKKDGKEWPPKFVMEKGAEIVFSFTGRRMRSYVEEQKRNFTEESKPEESKKESRKKSDETLPQPKSYLRSTP